jgi:small GTP-binding protein
MTDLKYSPPRVVAVGDSCVGKTSLISVVIGEPFNAYEPNTIGANWHLYCTTVNGSRCELQIWDTAGQERFRTLGPLYYRNAVAGLVVYDVTSRESFKNIARWTESLLSIAGASVKVFVVGNKKDLADERKVAYAEGLEWAKSEERNYEFFETSAKTGEGVTTVFQTIAEAIGTTERRRMNEPELAKGGEKCC